MAYGATVTLNDARGKSLHTICYGWMPPTDTEALADAPACDVVDFLRKRPDLRVMLVADGAPEMWNLLEYHLGDKALGLDTQRVFSFLDQWHVLKKLGKAAKIIWGAEAVNERITGWNKRLLRHS